MSFISLFVRFIPEPPDSLLNGTFLNVLNKSAAKMILSSATFLPKLHILLNIVPAELNIKSRALNPPNYTILDSWVFEIVILTDRPFGKAWRIFETCVS